MFCPINTSSAKVYCLSAKIGTFSLGLCLIIRKHVADQGSISQKVVSLKINRKCYFQAFDWLKFTLTTTDLRLPTFCEIDHRDFRKSYGQLVF